MKTGRILHSYDCLNHPYARVRDALHQDAPGIFRRATTTAAARASNIGAQLRVRIGTLDIAADIEIEIGDVHEVLSSSFGGPATVFQLSWKSIDNPGLFPVMKARLLVYPLSATETRLELEGSYHPPLGPLGDAMDALIGRRIAEASVLRFVQDVAELLRTELAPTRAETHAAAL